MKHIANDTAYSDYGLGLKVELRFSSPKLFLARSVNRLLLVRPGGVKKSDSENY